MVKKNKMVLDFVELTERFESDASELMSSISSMSEDEKKEIIYELEDVIQNVRFMINFFDCEVKTK